MGEEGTRADRTALAVTRECVWLSMMAVGAGRGCQAGDGRTGLVRGRLCAGCGWDGGSGAQNLTGRWWPLVWDGAVRARRWKVLESMLEK